MKIVMTLLVRDEEDIIRENIDYHLSQGVDFIIATDNRSVDATREILLAYEREGVLRYIHEASDDYNQHAWVTRMARMAFLDHAADWVINNDADEFWWPLEAENLRETFRAVPPDYNVVSAERLNFVPLEVPGSTFIDSMVFREAVSLNPLGRPLQPKVAHRGSAEVSVAQGNHAVEGMPEQRQLHGVIEIFHFPIRSYAQFENKIVKGGAAYERNEELPPGMGYTWRELFRQYQRDNGLHDYYDRQMFAEDRLRESLEAGTLIRDDRLSRYFARGMC